MFDKEFKTAVSAAKKAGRLLKTISQSDLKVEYKGEINLVTQADRAAEALVVKLLRQNFPGDDILTEESDKERTQSDRRWIIDPLDGTTNYAHRFPFWCVSIAFEYKGRVVLGVIYNPNLNELFTAQKGKGAWLNGQRIKVSSQTSLKKSLLATGFPYDVHYSKKDNLDNFRKFIKRAQAVRRPGSAALDLAYVACGRFDGFWEMKLKTWDIAAASLMVAEAEGKLSGFKGEKFSIYVPECLASNGRIHVQMTDVLK
ncbi:inositol monophosphatase [candidate division TA06 bacterium]|uniref:Inositol-1-monophosphatase n=1 Tax=candidate division TA06 bacterium TaxID=2250710 RepID=A0A933MKF3_UNCT6|nr:inositol monophosphatase [candidate division TA06 bacterium]